MKRKLIALIYLTLLTGWLEAQEFSVSDQSQIDTVLSKGIAEFNIPGVVGLVTNKDQVIYQGAFGKADIQNNVEMRTDNIFRIASMTKPITSAAVMLLIEQNKLKLNNPISNFLPQLANREIFTNFNFEDGTYETRPAQNEITIKHLLTHTSGLAYWFNSHQLVKLGNGGIVASWFYPLHHEPGERWTYSDATAVLGDLIVEVSDQDLFEFIDENLLTPLGMEETFFNVPGNETGRVVTAHRKVESKFVEVPNPSQITAAERGDGGLSSTAADYAKFMRMFLNDGKSDTGTRVLLKETIELMSMNHIGELKAELQPSANSYWAEPFPQGAGVDNWGLGFQLAGEGGRNKRSKGSMTWGGIYNTKFWIDEENGIAAILLMQYLPFDDEAALSVLGQFEVAIYKILH